MMSEVCYNKEHRFGNGGEDMDELEATIEHIVFQAGDGKFSVFRVRNAKQEKIAVVYKGVPPFLGEQVKLSGSWSEHPKFGRQFQALTWQTLQTSSAVGIERFLGSGAVHGVGKAMAARIVEMFGDETLKIIGEQSYRLTEVSGIGKKKADTIASSYAELSDMKELMLFLEEHGISSNYAPKIQAKYGNTALKRIEDNPYCLANDIMGIGFRTADRLAMAMGFKPENEGRIKAGIEFALTQTASAGHTCLP